ncbi:MAG: hypothetical protein R3211_03640 [Balneolaceae bacterium]|nr:hypothetical protein [Balneolaceae bacterium]
MKYCKAIPSLVVAIITILLLNIPLEAQQSDDVYLKFDYLQVKQGTDDQFLKVQRNHVKPLMQSRLEKGEILGWYQYRFVYPGGTSRSYNYLTVTLYTDLAQLERENSDSKIMQAHARRAGVSTLSHSEIWKKVIELDNQPQNFRESKYMMLDYMDVTPGMDYEYQMLEDEVARPIHQERIVDEALAGWEVYQLILPGGVNYGYDFVTGNFFGSLEHLEYGFTEEYISRAHPGEDMQEIFELVFDTRDLVRSEVWIQVDAVN